MSEQDPWLQTRQQQVDMTEAARGIFLAACQRALESKVSLDPAYLGKPLDHLWIDFSLHRPIDDDEPHVHDQRLIVMPLHRQLLGAMRRDENSVLHDAERWVRRSYRTIARHVGGLVLDDSLRFGDSLGHSSVFMSWQQYRDGKRQRYVNSFHAQPTAEDVALAGAFVRQIADYVRADEFDVPFGVRRNHFKRGFRQTDPAHDMRHEFNMRITPAVTLNGHEPQSFIELYAVEMKSLAERIQETMHDRRLKGATEDDLDQDRLALNKAEHALESAVRLLENE